MITVTITSPTGHVETYEMADHVEAIALHDDWQWITSVYAEDHPEIVEVASGTVPVCAACLASIHCGGDPDFAWRAACDDEPCGADDHEL